MKPSTTTTYTAVATNSKGTASATATVTVSQNQPTVNITATPSTITNGASSTLTVTATNAAQVTVTGTDGSSYTLQPTGGTQSVTPTATVTYTATATGGAGNVTATVTVTVEPAATLQSIKHVIFMLQENHSFDNYFGMLNPYRKANGWNIGDDGIDYEVDGIDDKLGSISNRMTKATCSRCSNSRAPASMMKAQIGLQAMATSIGSISRRHVPSPWTALCTTPKDMRRAVPQPVHLLRDIHRPHRPARHGILRPDFLNYYYYMASQFAVSDRWFSPVATKSIGNRIATFTGGTTQGLVKDPGGNDHLPQLDITSIFQELQQANVTWKIYYTVTQGLCLTGDDCVGSANANFPATDFATLSYSTQFVYENPTRAACTPPTQASSVVGDSTNSFCIDTSHIAPLSTYFTDLTNGTLPSFAFIEAGYGNNDEHPGSGQPILAGQAQVANIINSLMTSSSWNDSVFFFSYDEGGGPYDHVPPVPGHSNDYTDTTLGSIADISEIAVNPDQYNPCVPIGGTPTTHCDLSATDPGANPADAAAAQGFAAQLGFRLPNIIISPFTRRHYVSHTPMDHTAIIKFVENQFIGSSAHLTARDAAQPNLLDFFDFSKVPWLTPPSPPAPVSASSFASDPCTPTNFAPPAAPANKPGSGAQ